MTESKLNWFIHKDIPSEPLEACDLIRHVVERLETEKVGDELLFAVHMALEEAVMNAIKHGNKCDVNKRVHLEIDCNCTELKIKVRDEGAGFVPSDLPDPTDDEHVDIPSGRGVMLMREFMDEVSYNPAGNEVVMVKRKSAE